jgi:hypothetical protein
MLHALPISYSLILSSKQQVFRKGQRLWISSAFTVSQPPVTSPPSGPSDHPITLLSNTLNMCSSLNVTDQCSRAYKTEGKKISYPSEVTTYSKSQKYSIALDIKFTLSGAAVTNAYVSMVIEFLDHARQNLDPVFI